MDPSRSLEIPRDPSRSPLPTSSLKDPILRGQSSSLEHLCLSGCLPDMGKRAAVKTLADALTQGAGGALPLNHLDLSYNDIQDR